jgi:hypothetical protein
MPRRRKYRQRYSYTVRTDGTVMECQTPSQAMTLYERDPDRNKIIMTPKRGGIVREINPYRDRQNMLNLSFHDLVTRIRFQSPWACDREDTPDLWEHAIENALLLNIPRRMFMEIVRITWLMSERQDLVRELSKTHRRWLTQRGQAEKNAHHVRRVLAEKQLVVNENNVFRTRLVAAHASLAQLEIESAAKDRRIAELEELAEEYRSSYAASFGDERR